LPTIIVDKKEYRNNSAFVQVTGTINSANGKQVQFTTLCLIDTGFYDGVFLPNKFYQLAKSIGVDLTQTHTLLADGSETVTFSCLGAIQKIENYSFVSGKKEVMILICAEPSTDELFESTSDLIGMGALQYFTVTFDGPNQVFTISESV